MILHKIQYLLRLYRMRVKWRKENRDNDTVMLQPFDIHSVHVGRGTYGGLIVQNDVKGRILKIGSYCSIAQEVVFLLGNDHRLNLVSTFPFRSKCIEQKQTDAVSYGDITVADDVWIGRRSIILSGVSIGQGAVIAAGAVVSKNIPPYAVAGGVPARILRYRFDSATIEELMKLDYTKLSKPMAKAHMDELYRVVKKECDVKNMRWFPRKG